jgi:NAD(P)-dependent dehydrogenase (short-subunit alcohol dehydrogenase family)
MGAEQKKVAVVTGASQGIGAGIVQAFRDRNCRVVATSRSIKPVADPDVVTVQGDVGTPDTAEKVFCRRSFNLKRGSLDEVMESCAVWYA